MDTSGIMKLVLFLSVLFGTYALAAHSVRADTSPPTWEIHDLCPVADNDECLRIENGARLSVLARWVTVPEADRVVCMKKIDQDDRRSYRRLDDCFDDRAMKALESAPGPKK